MSEEKIEDIYEQLKSKIKSQKEYENNMLDFLSVELSNSSTLSDKEINLVSDNFNSKYMTKNEIFNNLKTRIQQLIPNDNNPMSPGLENELKQIVSTLDEQRDLSSTVDKNPHFGGLQLRVLQGIFNMQITQKYLSALKFVITNELIVEFSS